MSQDGADQTINIDFKTLFNFYIERLLDIEGFVHWETHEFEEGYVDFLQFDVLEFMGSLYYESINPKSNKFKYRFDDSVVRFFNAKEVLPFYIHDEYELDVTNLEISAKSQLEIYLDRRVPIANYFGPQWVYNSVSFDLHMKSQCKANKATDIKSILLMTKDGYNVDIYLKNKKGGSISRLNDPLLNAIKRVSEGLESDIEQQILDAVRDGSYFIDNNFDPMSHFQQGKRTRICLYKKQQVNEDRTNLN